MGQIEYSSRRRDITNDVNMNSSYGYYQNTSNPDFKMEVAEVTYSGDSNSVISILYSNIFDKKPNITFGIVLIDDIEGDSITDGTDLDVEIPIVILRHLIINSNYVGVDVLVQRTNTNMQTIEINIHIVGGV
jgi:hypothetical protein